MSNDKACISAVKEVCQRCPLYKENCGMLDFPDQCSISGRYIDGYHQAEKDLELTWRDIENIITISYKLDKEEEFSGKYAKLMTHYQEVLNRFKERKEK